MIPKIHFIQLLLYSTLLFCSLSIDAHVRSPNSNGRWVAWSAKPALAWEDAFVTGNGRHGTMVAGAAGSSKITIVHEELFLRSWDRNKIAVANIADLIPQIRNLVDSGRFTEAATLANNEARGQLTKMGAPQIWPVSPHPAFDLNVAVQPNGVISGYRRQLNMESGEVITSWNSGRDHITENVFSSRIHNVNIYRIKHASGRKLNVTINLSETPGRSGSIYDLDISNAFVSTETKAIDSKWLSYHAQYSKDSGGYEGLARITCKGGELVQVNNQIQAKNADEILVIMRVTPLKYGKTTEQTFVRNELENLPTKYEDLIAPHAKKHGEMFRRVTLDLGSGTQWSKIPTEQMLTEAKSKGITALFLEQMHAMGRYLLISSSGKYPPPLQGIWGGGWKPDWVGGFVFDSNVNLAISAISTGDLTEAAESYFGYVERLLPAWRLNAASYLGTRGFLVPHYSDPENGFLNHFAESYPWMYWPSSAGWNLMPFYEHGMLMGDRNFLRERVLPLYLEMGQFYEDYLTKENDGYYHISPGISPENFLTGQKTILAKDATIDIAVAREVFDHLLNLGKMFNLDQKDLEKWQHYHDNLIPYRINADGALAEWIPKSSTDNYAHRHSSHLYPVFPGTELVRADSDAALFKAARVALDRRFKFDTESAHGLIHVALMASRLHDPEKVKINLDRFAQRDYVYEGLSTSHDPNHHIYNLDAALSLQRLVSEMLVFSQPGRIELLPACPKGFPGGTLAGVRIHGGHKFDITWAQGRVRTATIHAGKNDTLAVVLENKTKKLVLQAGKKYRFDGDLRQL